jgi:hypothetical protein
MKKLILSAFITLFAASTYAQQVFFQESFEDTTNWTISHLFDDGFEDYILNDHVDTINARSAGPDFSIYGADSTHVMAFEDINSGDAGSTSSNGEVELNIDSIYIQGGSGLSIHMAAAGNPTAGRYDKALNWFGSNGNGDTVAVQVKIDGGNYTKVMYFCTDSAGAGNQSNVGPLYFDENLDYDGGNGANEIALDDTLQDFSSSVTGTGAYLSIKVKLRVESGDEEFVMDNIRLSATTAPCNMPSSVSTSNVDTSSADISWTSGGASNAVIQYGGSGFTLGQGTMVSATSSPFSLTGLNPATTYEYYIKDSCGSSSTSLWVGPFTFTTQSNTCNAPTNFALTALADTGASFSWTTGGATAWNIEYGAGGFTPGTGTMVANLSSASYTLNGLMSGTAYDIYVQDTCGGGLGASAWVGPLSFTTLANPTVLDAYISSNTSIEVVFSDSIDLITGLNTANYMGITGLNSVNLNSSLDTATLTYASPFADGVTQNLMISDAILGLNRIKLDTVYNFSFLWNSSTPLVVITEIMYNDLSSTDTLEFVELYNNGAGTAQLGGMSFTQGADFEFPAGATLAPGAYALVAANASAINSAFGISGAFEFTGGSLSNSGEDILLVNTEGDTIDYVNYDDRAPWDYFADGFATSLVLCDPNDDNSLSSSWWREQNTAAGHRTSPGSANACWSSSYTPPAMTVATAKSVDNDGVLDSLNRMAALTGVVFTPDYDGNSGYSFFMYDSTGGINIFNFDDVPGYSTPEVGDSITAYGLIIQYNGLAELRVDSIHLLDSNIALIDPAVVTTLDESTEGEYIRIRNVFVADTNDWNGSGSYNVDIVTPTNDTLSIRVDSDMDVNSVWTSAPMGLFDITGVGAQFDFSSPYTSGYQMYPRFYTDIDTSTCNQPSALALDNVDSTEATVSWMSAASSDLEYGVDGFTLGTGTMVMAAVSPYTITGLDDTTAYEFYVRQVCATKMSDWEGPFDFTTLAGPDPNTGVELIRATNDFRVFPNPSNGTTVKFSRNADIRVMDVLGNFILAEENAESLDVSQLNSGMYFIIESEGTMIKLIVE